MSFSNNAITSDHNLPHMMKMLCDDRNKIRLKTESDIVVHPLSIIGAIINYSEEEKANLIVIGTREDLDSKKCSWKCCRTVL